MHTGERRPNDRQEQGSVQCIYPGEGIMAQELGHCGRIPVSYIQGPISVPGILFPLHPPANVPGDQQTTVQVLKSLSLTWETLALSWPIPAVVAI